MTGPNELGRKYRLSPGPSQSTSYETVAIGSAMFYAVTVLFAMDPVIYLVSVPVPFLFGSVVVLNMLGEHAVCTAVAAGEGRAERSGGHRIRREPVARFLGVDAGGERRAALRSARICRAAVARALLAVTIPFLVIHAAFFHFWPLQKGELAAGAAVDQREASVQ